MGTLFFQMISELFTFSSQLKQKDLPLETASLFQHFMLDDALRQHRVRNLQEARDIRADHKIILMPVFLRSG